MAENLDRPDRPERAEGEMDFSEEGFGDKAPRRYQRRRPRQVVPDYVDWKDVDLLRQFVPVRMADDAVEALRQGRRRLEPLALLVRNIEQASLSERRQGRAHAQEDHGEPRPIWPQKAHHFASVASCIFTILSGFDTMPVAA